MAISYFDAHCDTIGMCLGKDDSLRANRFCIDLERGAAFKRYAQMFALFADAGKAAPGAMWKICCRLYERLCSELEENRELAVLCRSGREIDAAIHTGRTAALVSIEGADLLECREERIETAATWGVRFLNLTWNHTNAISGSHLQDSERGISRSGRNFVRRMEDCGIYADASHLSDAGFWDLIRMSRRPVIASHSNARALCPHSRNLTDDMFRAIRDSGGVVGINYYAAFVGGAQDMDALIAHVEHFLALDGEKTVCFGGDMDGCDVLAGGIAGLQDIPGLYEALHCRGYRQELLEDLFWNNLRRLF